VAIPAIIHSCASHVKRLRHNTHPRPIEPASSAGARRGSAQVAAGRNLKPRRAVCYCLVCVE